MGGCSRRQWTDPCFPDTSSLFHEHRRKCLSNQRYSPEFKDEAFKQILERGYSVSEVSERLALSDQILHKWVNAVKARNLGKSSEFGEPENLPIVQLRRFGRSESSGKGSVFGRFRRELLN